MTCIAIARQHAIKTASLFSVIVVLGLQHCRADDSPASRVRPLEADEVERLEPAKLKELIVIAQDRIEITSKLDGVMVTEIRISKSDENRVRTVELEGRVRDPQQRALAARVVDITMQSVSFWSSSDDEFVVNPEKLAITEPSAELGAKSLGAAMEQFFAGQHERADMLLTHALVENPGNEVTHYWKVANCIALKQNDRAERRLEILTRRNPMGSDGYAGQLQRLQGQYRRAIIDMEQKLMLRNR
jgi:hypothetical protein